MHQFCSLVSVRFSDSSFGSWYKDGEQLLTSIPGYIVIKDRDLRLVANEFNEGTYTCRIHRRGNVVSANSWAIRLKPEQSSNNSWWSDWRWTYWPLALPPGLNTTQQCTHLRLEVRLVMDALHKQWILTFVTLRSHVVQDNIWKDHQLDFLLYVCCSDDKGARFFINVNATSEV